MEVTYGLNLYRLFRFSKLDFPSSMLILNVSPDPQSGSRLHRPHLRGSPKTLAHRTRHDREPQGWYSKFQNEQNDSKF
jgi:hypothetical protein